MNINSRCKLNNGYEMPYFGLGVYKIAPGKETIEAVSYALQVGYRLIDTAAVYGNEKEVGIAVKQSGIPRKEIFITTKLWNDDHGYDATLKAFDESLKRLQLDYVDLYLIHWPVPKLRKDSWKALERIYRDGKALSIGVSNYMIKHLEELKTYAEIIPTVNQVEFSPFLYQKDLLDYCRENKIEVEAYSPLARMKRKDNPVVNSIAKKYGKTHAQVLIRWCLEHKLIVIPKSSDKKRIKENADVFDFKLDEEDMRKLNSLNENFRVSWDPTEIE
ncbi:MAG: aldo/keto reductase [Ignavibacterium sp.]|uniref:aldo/keto reductase n=1 Tax=Ignavibacterium sp. TaxID=2651167 RepID=UPI00404B6136